MQEYRRGNFAPQACARCPDLLPKLAVVVHNRHNVYNTRATSSFKVLHDEQGWRVYQAFVAAVARTERQDNAPPVFVDKGLPNPKQFPVLYTGGPLAGQACWRTANNQCIHRTQTA